MNKINTFYEILSAKDHPFADEIDKKKMLDLAAEVKAEQELDILAYCVTDDECHFLICNCTAEKIAVAENWLMNKFSSHYEEKYEKPWKGLKPERRFQKYMTEEEIIDSCLKIHLIPMEQRLARKPEDYWWCSYVDYRRQYKRGIVNTDLVLHYLDSERKRAVRKFVSLHHITLYNKGI